MDERGPDGYAGREKTALFLERERPMPVITCPDCLHKLTMPAAVGGQRVKCPKCESDFEPHPEATLAVDASPQKAVDAPAQPVTAPPLDGAYSENRVRHARSSAPRTVFCSECGTKIPTTDDVCPGCGLSLDEMQDRREARRPLRPQWRELPPMRTSLAFFTAMLLFLGAWLFFGALILGDVLRNNPPRDLLVGITCVVAGGVELAAFICCFIWLYQAWRLVTHEDDDYSPELRVGLLFVPVFNVYWMFVAIPALSAAIQNELRYLAPRRDHNTGRIPGLIACILLLIPYFQPVAVCMFIAWMLLANNALQRLIRYHERLRDEAETREDEP